MDYKKKGFITEFIKIGNFLNLSDVEDHINTYFDDSVEPYVRSLITSKVNDSFSLRHPILTGIPTLGIWPAIEKRQAMDDITRLLARKHAPIRDALQLNRMEALERYKANQMSRAVALNRMLEEQ